jgi:hypothetical protein
MSVNNEFILLDSLSRTTSDSSSVQANPDGAGVIVLLTITTGSATGGLMPQVKVVNPATGTQEIITNIPIPVRAAGVYAYHFYPAAHRRHVACHFASPIYLPLSWRLLVTPDDASPIEYSVGGQYVRGA